ncbi:MAG: hypothetical protein H6719_25815 [Sandaracinaceae bacterium]|nr:hypothetical protein [Sandaracinaceae bacterium]
MRLLALLNKRSGLKPDQSTTAMVIEAARRYGHSWVAGVSGASLDESGDVSFNAIRITPELASTREALRALRLSKAEPVSSRDLDVVLIRTNPGRDRERAVLHETLLNLCRIAQSRGVVVLNDPRALPKASDKLFLSYLPEALRPRMIVSRDAARLIAFVEETKGPTVLKPLFGTQGRGVFKVTGGNTNLAALVEVLTSEGYVIAQDYLRRAPEGDRRIIVVDGKPLEVDGKTCAVRRKPTDGEFRSNVHLGGTPMKAESSPAVIRAAALIGEVLIEHGIWMAGIDLVGTKAVEVNVRSPGGIIDAAQFEGADFIGAVLDSVLAKVESRDGGRPSPL